MTEFFTGTNAVDLVLVFLITEGILLNLLYERQGMGMPPERLWPMLVSGVGLLLALRAALADAGWLWVLAGLALAFTAHFYDLRGRWQPRIL